MSLILDALKKAEQDRHAGQAPVLDDLLIERRPMPLRRRDRQQDVVVVAAAIGAVVFALAGLAYWWLPAPMAKPAAVTVAKEGLKPSPTPADTPLQTTAEPAAPAQALRVDPERLQTPMTAEPAAAPPTSDDGAVQATTMDELDGDVPPAASGKLGGKAAAGSAAPRAARTINDGSGCCTGRLGTSSGAGAARRLARHATAGTGHR